MFRVCNSCENYIRIFISMEEPNTMTVESLRARLLSERSASKSERQRAHELAQRVAELEEHLKVVSLQRNRAEKATADVLAILANHGMTALSEGFDSNSEPDGSEENGFSSNGSMLTKETSTNPKLTENESEAFSSSEFECSSLTGRILPWKSTRDSHHSVEKKNACMDLLRRRDISASNGYSARKFGKSCRRIRRRETRSVDEPQIEDSKSENSAEHKVSNDTIQDYILSALQHQAQSVDRSDEERKFFREEVACRENSTGTQDSLEPGNNSDVAEEQYGASSATEAMISDCQWIKQGPTESGLSKEPWSSEHSLSIADALYKGTKQTDSRSISLLSHVSSGSGFSFSVLKEKSDQAPHGSCSDANLALTDIPDNVASVLKALQQARLVLNQERNSLLPAAGQNSTGNILKSSGSEAGNEDILEIPFATSTLFRLPTGYELGKIARTDLQYYGLKSSIVDYPAEISEKRFPSSSILQSRMVFSTGLFRTCPAGPLATEIRRPFSSLRPLSQQGQRDDPTTTNRMMNSVVSLSDHLHPLARDAYPYLPNITLPSLGKWSLRSSSSSETGLPKFTGLSSYDNFISPR